jgi:SAM-dependent methyltransferase
MVVESPPAPPERAEIDVATMRGLEIGPLANPRVRKSEGAIFYLDHMSTDDLRDKYAKNETLRPNIDALVEVDFVQHTGDRLADAVGESAPFDYVIASHVAEHIPNLIGWLHELGGVLREGGILSLILPDKRYCFDLNRTPTEMSTLVDAYLRDAHKPSYAQMFDNFSRTVTVDGMVDTVGLWDGTVDYEGVVRSDVESPTLAAWQLCLSHKHHPEHPIDIHCNVFTPDSFLGLLAQMIDLDLIEFDLASFTPTQRNGLEFYVILRKGRPNSSDNIRRHRLASAASEHEPLESPSPDPEPPPEAPSGAKVVLSPREEHLIAAKRRLGEKIKAARRRFEPKTQPTAGQEP